MEPCPSCGHESRAGQRFCAECGAGLAAACPACGIRSEPGEKFCGQCGQALGASPPARTPTPQPSASLPTSFASGRYEVKRFLGEGGRKRVYLAYDTKLDRDVAIAVIKTEGLDADGLTRVRREAQAMGRLGDHPHIVTVFDIGDEVGQPYIVSQYMEGGDLEGLLRGAANHRLPLDQAGRIASDVQQALEHAHSHGIIHRDLKPGNIWLTRDGTLSNRRVWAELGTRLADGICLDADGHVWVANPIAAEAFLVAEGGAVIDVVKTDQPCFACMLGGPQRKHLFLLTAPGSDASLASSATNGHIQVAEVSVSGTGLP